MARRNNDFQTIHSAGGLLPPDLLRRVLDTKERLEGTKAEDYGLPPGNRPNEVITQTWNRLCKHWIGFRAAVENLPEGEAATGLTNDKWNLPLLRELGFGVLPTTPSPEIEGRTYAISRFSGPVPIHLIGCGLSLDKRTAGARGAAAANPHGLVQEFLNRSDAHLWAIVSNGLRLRILRDNIALSRQSYLEFDLEAMFAGEVSSDFTLLWLVAHATRFVPRDGDKPESCWLEKWTQLADEQGARALSDLRGGVEKALQILGEGFTSHPKNTALRDTLRDGQLSLVDFHGQLLRVVYRLIFLFVAEDRLLDGQSILHPRDTSEAAHTARERYGLHYSTARLRELAGRIKGSRHGDLWRQLQLIVRSLSGDERYADIREHLALPGLGSFLWNPESTTGINDAELTNYDFLEALRHLAFTRQGKVLRPVDYKNLGAEELGGVYESLLALTPQISADGAQFTFAEFAGSERKTSGSYYTPDSLVQCLLDSALDPVVEEAIKGKSSQEAEKAILELKVCDPAVGSGHFLVGAAHRLARHLARIRALTEGESEPSPLLYQHALRDVISRCLYGVDINPMATELCRVSLWLEAIEPGKPLSFLDHHIKCGNSLLGTTPALMSKGIPDEVFKPIEGDVKSICNEFKRQNREERQKGQRFMLFEDEKTYAWDRLGDLTQLAANLDDLSDDDIASLDKKRQRYEKLVKSAGYEYGHLLADLWCAAFVIKKDNDLDYAITENIFRDVEKNPHSIAPWLKSEVRRLAEEYQCFHWHLEFPSVFQVPPKGKDQGNEHTGLIGGFDVVLGNPPWEVVSAEEQEFFAASAPHIVSLPTRSKRLKAISALEQSDPKLFSEWVELRRHFAAIAAFAHQSGRYPFTGKGNLNSYLLFSEAAMDLLCESGRSGTIVPSAVASSDTAKVFFNHLVTSKRLAALFDFENKRQLFPAVDSRMKFCLLTMTAAGTSPIHIPLAFFLHSVDELRDSSRIYSLQATDFQLLNPNTGNAPTFRSRQDAEIVLHVYHRLPVLRSDRDHSHAESNVEVTRMVDLSYESSYFVNSEQLENSELSRKDGIYLDPDGAQFLPVYEAKMTQQYDHRAADVVISKTAAIRSAQQSSLDGAEHKDPNRLPEPRFFMENTRSFRAVPEWYTHNFFLSYTLVTSPTNQRTLLASIIPKVPAGHSLRLVYIRQSDALLLTSQLSALNSFALDYVCRQKIGGVNLNPIIVYQLPIVPNNILNSPCVWFHDKVLKTWLSERVLELTYTAWDLEAFALDCGYSGPPFRWDQERRFLLRCELDAAYFHLYLGSPSEWGTDSPQLREMFPAPLDAVDYIMETFPIVKRKDIARTEIKNDSGEVVEGGRYITKDTILEIYDKMAEAIQTGQPYQTILDPPPADPLVAHTAETKRGKTHGN